MMTAEQFWQTLPHCCGYPKCDGDLEATPHSKECPLFGKKEMDPFVFANAYAAALEQAQIAAAYKDAAQIADTQEIVDSDIIAAEISKRTPADAQAALAAMLKSAQAKGEIAGLRCAAKKLCIRCRRDEPITVPGDKEPDYHRVSHNGRPCMAWKIAEYLLPRMVALKQQP